MITLTEYQKRELDGAAEEIVETLLEDQINDVINNVPHIDSEGDGAEEIIKMREYLVDQIIKTLKPTEEVK